jgi:cytochrome c oxidase assembly factor CtaG/polyferredoxin
VTDTAAAVLASWTIRPAVVLPAVAVALLYLRGVRRMPASFPRWRVAAFLGGIATLVVAVASPLDAFGGLLLSAHMLQHVILMMVAPALVLLGAPGVPLLRGLPTAVAKDGLGPFLAWRRLRQVGDLVVHPVFAWLAFVVCTWVWHVPAAYEFALRAPGWHATEHAMFLATALLFWFPVVQPWPSRARWPRWTMVPYLVLADAQNTVLAALFTFSDRVIYPIYASVPRLGGMTPLDDQAAAGVIMWVPGSIAYLVPAALVVFRLLSPSPAPSPPARVLRPARPFDLLDVSVIGWLLRRPLSRRVAQAVLLVVALAIVADGLLGPQMSPMNLAGVLPWTYWRGLTVVALLAAGNLFCFACPFTLPRALARRIATPPFRWPERLRSKWLAIALLVVFLCAYEAFDLWDSPWWTAWLVVGYFAAALVVDTCFAGASFCKYVCPIGQFQFVQSLVSPLEVRVRRPAACADCRTQDCLRGNAHARGCELDLFLPRKVGNLDCTFCLDCVHACPHDNVGILVGGPARDLVSDPPRAGIGRLSRRGDVAYLALVLVLGAFAGAAAMVGPVQTWADAAAARLGLGSGKAVTSAVLLAVLVLVPMLGGVGRERARRFALTLVPLGFAMWTAHLVFHLVSGWDSLAMVAGRWLPDVAAIRAGRTGPDILGLEILLLDAGLLVTLYSMWRTVRTSNAAAMIPWAAVAVGLYGTGIWIFLQPMQMRGMMMH